MKTKIRCQVHGQQVVTDCQLKECVFNTKYPGVHNCILVYMAKQDVDSLKPLDIAMLKGWEPATVNRDLLRATTLMRNSTLRVSNNIDVEPSFSTIMGLSVCYACEAPINSKNWKTAVEAKTPKSKESIWYCSNECHDARPPACIGAEHACRTSIAKIAEWAIKKYSTLGGLEQALGMNREMLGTVLKKHLSKNAEELYATTQRVKTRNQALVRRTGSRPEWLANFHELLLPLVDEMTSKYGKPKGTMVAISAEVQKTIDAL